MVSLPHLARRQLGTDLNHGKNTPQENDAMLVSNSKNDVRLDGGLELNASTNRQNARTEFQITTTRKTGRQLNVVEWFSRE